jgi:signal transduction histidine kinase
MVGATMKQNYVGGEILSGDRPGRIETTLLAFGYLLLAIPTVPLFVLSVVGISLTVVTVGFLLLLAAVPLTQALADAHRRIATRVLGVPVPSPYRPNEEGLRRFVGWAADRARWRDLLWLLVTMSAGFVISVLAVVWILAIGWYLVFPLVWAVTPDGTFDMNFGILTVDTLGETFLMWIFAIVAVLLWWYLTPILVRTKARIDKALLSPTRAEELARRVEQVTASRAESVDFSAAEVRRIERDLHDGAQARLVALGMSLGMADDLLSNDPDAARRLLADARATTTAALSDLRGVVRGIHPPVLADRGLAGAVEALAIALPVPVAVVAELPGRPPAPVESAVYFAVAECLANIGKHAGAGRAAVWLTYGDGQLRVTVADDGVGGADIDRGTGLTGVARRLRAFDGTMALSSPKGGPTTVTMEVPCALSSPKTSPSSGTG